MTPLELTNIRLAEQLEHYIHYAAVYCQEFPRVMCITQTQVPAKTCGRPGQAKNLAPLQTDIL